MDQNQPPGLIFFGLISCTVRRSSKNSSLTTGSVVLCESSKMDYDNPKNEEKWCAERRREVAAYLAIECVPHGEIGDWPAWHLPPYVSIWAVGSLAEPNRIAWWAISGDIPTDYLSAATITNPRDALLGFVSRWRNAADLMEWTVTAGFLNRYSSEVARLVPDAGDACLPAPNMAADAVRCNEL